MTIKLFAATLAAGAVLGVMGGVAQADTTIKAMFQGDPWEVQAISAAANRFEAANPGVHV